MAFELLGTTYGGWMIDLNLVPKGSTIISAGVGEDISFDLVMINEKNCKIVGIDPTPKSHLFIEKQKNLFNFDLIKKVLHSQHDDVVKLYKNKNREHVSESILPTHDAVLGFDSYYSDTVSLENLFEEYKDISIIKMDIEGSEYDVIANLKTIPKSVKQFCVEFHHFCTDKTVEDTKEMIESLSRLGFKNYVEKPSPKQLNELTFWR